MVLVCFFDVIFDPKTKKCMIFFCSKAKVVTEKSIMRKRIKTQKNLFFCFCGHHS